MNLHAMLQKRAAEKRPIRIGLVGAGKFGTMFLAQARFTPGMQVAAVCDLQLGRAREALKHAGWPAERFAARDIAEAARTGGTHLTEDAAGTIAADGIDLVIDSTGNPAAGIAHALLCCKHKKHIVMVNVEADALAGPLLARRAREAGIVYSLAYGDQPALVCEMVDWARAAGFPVIAAGKGSKYLPGYHQCTPETVWQHYGIAPERAAAGGMNPKMFTSFLDGTKSAIEMAAVSNATGLLPQTGGLKFPPCGTHDLARVLRPAAEGGVLEKKGVVEVVSSEEPDGRHVVGHLRWGMYVVMEAPSDYAKHCFEEYGLVTDPSGRYMAMWKPFHLIGLELGISIASAALRGEPTGAPVDFRGDVVATAKKNLAPGETLDGEGGYAVYGKLTPAAESLAHGLLPLGLAHGVKLRHAVTAGAPVRWADVAIDESDEAVRVRREMERSFGTETKRQAAE